MKIISLGFDNSVLNKESILAKKTIEYGAMVDKYFMIVPAEKDTNCFLSDHVQVLGVAACCRLAKLWKMYFLAKRIVEENKCELITTQDPFELGLLGYLIKKQCKTAWNVQEHGDFFSQPYWKNEGFLNLGRFYLGLYLIKKADSIRVVSKRTKECLVTKLRINKDRIVVVPVFTELRSELKILPAGRHGKNEESCLPVGMEKIKNNDFVFLNMGRFVKQKNLPLLIRAFATVNEKHPEARLRLIGRGKLESDLKRQVMELNLDKVLEFIPWTDDVAKQYQKADAYVLSSNYEGWGRVIVEAAHSKLPIVMTDVGCANELIINEESGLLVPVDDEEALVMAMVRMIEDVGLRKHLSEGAFKAIESLPSKDKTLALYKESWERAMSIKN